MHPVWASFVGPALHALRALWAPPASSEAPEAGSALFEAGSAPAEAAPVQAGTAPVQAGTAPVEAGTAPTSPTPSDPGGARVLACAPGGRGAGCGEPHARLRRHRPASRTQW